MLGALDKQEYPFDNMVSRLSLTREASRNLLVETLFSYNRQQALYFTANLQAVPYFISNQSAQFDISVHIEELTEDIDCQINYASSLFEKAKIKRLGKHYVNLLADIVENTVKSLAELSLLIAEEQKQLLFEFNATYRDILPNKTYLQLFEEQAAKTPDNIAVVFKQQQLTYEQLNAKANSLAHTLRAKGVKRNSLVEIMTERSLAMLAAVLAVLKAGGAYLPIDPDYPLWRIEFMLEDSGISLLLRQGSTQSKADNFSGEFLNLAE